MYHNTHDTNRYSPTDGRATQTRFERGLTGAHSRYERVQRAGRLLDDACLDRLYTAYTDQIWPAEITKAPSWESSDDVTTQTQDWVDVITDMQDPIFDQYENIPDLAGLEVKSAVKRELTRESGWSLDSIIEQLQPLFESSVAANQVETIARTETAATLNRAQLAAIEALPDASERLVRWVGPSDGRQTDLCNDLADATESGVPFSEFQPLAREYAEQYPAGKTDRLEAGILHFQERYTVELLD